MARFFQISGEVSSNPHIEEVLLHRYGNGIEYILRKPFEEGAQFIIQSIKAHQEDRLYRWWCAIVPNMTSETFMSFEDFRDRMTGANIDKRPAEEILAEAEEIEKRLKHGS